MPDNLEIKLGDISGLDLDLKPVRGEPSGSLSGQGLLSSLFASLLVHGAAVAAFLTFSMGSYPPLTDRIETVQIQLLPVNPSADEEPMVDAVQSGPDQAAPADLAQEELVKESMEESMEEFREELIVEPTQGPREPESIVEASPESAIPVEIAEPSLPSIVSIRNTIDDIESESGTGTWVTDCVSSPAYSGTEGHRPTERSIEEYQECTHQSERDYSAADRNPVYDGLNRLREPVSRSRRTVPLLASQRRSIARQLKNNNVADEISDVVMSELNNSVNTYYGNHRAGLQHLQTLGQRDPAAAALQQIFSPDIVHWMQTRKMENP